MAGFGKTIKEQAFMSEHNKPNQSRRQLLKNIGLSVAAGAVVAGTAKAAQAKTEKPEDNTGKKNNWLSRNTAYSRLLRNLVRRSYK
jgi:hypothetical protein